jgi:hypothetical protein
VFVICDAERGEYRECGHDHGARDAPLADRVDLEQFEVGQVDAESQPSEAQEAAGEAGRVAPDERGGKDGQLPDQPEEGDRHAGQLGVPPVRPESKSGAGADDSAAASSG